METNDLNGSRMAAAGMTILTGCLFALSFSPVGAAVQDGYVVKVESATVYLDWGQAAGVKAGDRFSVYQKSGELKHPVTGEVLGQSEEMLAQGALERIDQKFSEGRLYEIRGNVQAGQRARLQEPAPAAMASSPPTAVTLSQTLRERWRSAAIPMEATGLAIGDLDGDGQKELVAAFEKRIEVFRWNGRELQSAAVFKGRGYSHWLAVEVADLEGTGRDKIFASHFTEGTRRTLVVVLDYTPDGLREVGRFAGFARAVERAGGPRQLLRQDISMAREFQVRQPAPVLKTEKGYKAGPPLKLPRALNNDQLFGYTWGDWDGDGAEDLALLQGGDRLRLFFAGAKWSAPEAYGGAKTVFSWEGDQVGYVFPRLVSWTPPAGPPSSASKEEGPASINNGARGKTQLIVPHNIPATFVRLARLKIYKTSEVLALAWNGLEMAPVWRQPIAGAVADFAIGDGLHEKNAQLWVAAIGAGGKTVLIAYQLP